MKNAKDNLGDKNDAGKEIEACKKNIDGIRIACREANDRYAKIGSFIDDNLPEINSIKERIQRMENIEHQKLLAIREMQPDVYTAVMWLQENQHLFEGKIYNPIILELKILNLADAVYIENTVQMRDLYGFICENRNDMNLMVKFLVVEKGLKISCLHSPQAEFCQYNPTMTIDGFR